MAKKNHAQGLKKFFSDTIGKLTRTKKPRNPITRTASELGSGNSELRELMADHMERSNSTWIGKYINNRPEEFLEECEEIASDLNREGLRKLIERVDDFVDNKDRYKLANAILNACEEKKMDKEMTDVYNIATRYGEDIDDYRKAELLAKMASKASTQLIGQIVQEAEAIQDNRMKVCVLWTCIPNADRSQLSEILQKNKGFDNYLDFPIEQDATNRLLNFPIEQNASRPLNELTSNVTRRASASELVPLAKNNVTSTSYNNVQTWVDQQPSSMRTPQQRRPKSR